MSSKQCLSVAEVNSLSAEDFINVFGNVVENCALCAAAVYGFKPFTSDENLQTRFQEFLDNLPLQGKAGVLRLYPDLAGKLAKTDGLTSESRQEHASAGLDQLTPEESLKMAELNTKYKEKFSFPFVICARENKKEAILKGFEVRLNNSVEVEIENGLKEVQKICALRLQDLVSGTQF